LARSAPEKPRGTRRDALHVESGRVANFLEVNREDLHAATYVGQLDHDAAIEAPGAQQRRIQHFRSIGRGQQHHPVGGIEAVHLDQQLIQGLLLLVVTTHPGGSGAPRLPDRVELVDEDDARRLGLRLLEEIPHARRTHPHEHLDELRATDREERHLGLAGDRPRQQRLAGAGRADQQHAFRDLRAEALIALRCLEEAHDLDQLGFGFLDARHVVETDLDVLLAVDASAVLAEREGLPDAALHQPSRREAPDQHHDADRQHPPDQHITPEGVLDAARELDVLMNHFFEQRLSSTPGIRVTSKRRSGTAPAQRAASG